MNNQEHAKLLLTTAELVSLLQAANVPHLADSILNAAGNKPGQPDPVDAKNSLIDRGFVEKSGEVSSQYQKILSPLFHPETMLMLVLIHSNRRQETLTFVRKDDAILLYYSMPGKDLHCVEEITSPDQIRALIAEQYDIQRYAPVEMHCKLPAETFEQARSAIEKGEPSNAAKILNKANCPEAVSGQLVDTLRKPFFSGSVAVLEFNGDTAEDGASIALLASEQTLWHISQPDLEPAQLVIDGNTDGLTRLLDKIIQRFLGDEMLDEPLNKQNVVTFTLSADELAYCLYAVNAAALAATMLKSTHPDASDAERMNRLQTAGDELATRGWCKPSGTGLPVLAGRLESAVFPLIRYDYMVQAEITRPDLHSIADINILSNRLFTSLIHPSPDLYILEHGHPNALSAYVSKLFLDFGEGGSKSKKREINYTSVSEAMEIDTNKQLNMLTTAGFGKTDAEQFVSDFSNASYRGSIMRINANSQTEPDAVETSKKPLLLLLRGSQNSWLFEFSSANEEMGTVRLVDRVAFEKTLDDFLK